MNTYQYMSYPPEVRRLIKKKFNIKPSSGVVVFGDTVTDEGVLDKDLAHVTLEEVQAFVEEIANGEIVLQTPSGEEVTVATGSVLAEELLTPEIVEIPVEKPKKKKTK